MQSHFLNFKNHTKYKGKILSNLARADIKHRNFEVVFCNKSCYEEAVLQINLLTEISWGYF